MRVCLDTNVLLRLFAPSGRFEPILLELLSGGLDLAVSNEMLLEYEEMSIRLAGPKFWRRVAAILEQLKRERGNVFEIHPTFRFHVIAADPDDNKFVDCAIVAEADFLLTDDHHFSALIGSGYKPRPITPDDFIAQHLP